MGTKGRNNPKYLNSNGQKPHSLRSFLEIPSTNVLYKKLYDMI